MEPAPCFVLHSTPCFVKYGRTVSLVLHYLGQTRNFSLTQELSRSGFEEEQLETCITTRLLVLLVLPVQVFLASSKLQLLDLFALRQLEPASLTACCTRLLCDKTSRVVTLSEFNALQRDFIVRSHIAIASNRTHC